MMRKITLNGQELRYELERKNVKNLNIRIKAGGSIYVSAPDFVPEKDVERFFTEKASEILRSVKKYSAVKPYTCSERLENGSRVYLLGQPLTLRTERAESNMVTRAGDTLIVYSAGGSTEAIVSAWYDIQCRRILPEIGHRVYGLFSEYVPDEPVYSYKSMKSRWGSCSPSKLRMSINRELVKYDERLIEFVYCHEYSHFIHPNHSQDFYRFMDRMMPDHRERKRELENMAAAVRACESV